MYQLVESEPCVCDELISEPWGNWSVCILPSVPPPLSTHGWRGEKEVRECGDGKRYHAIACLDQKGRLLDPSQCADTGQSEPLLSYYKFYPDIIDNPSKKAHPFPHKVCSVLAALK